MSAVREALDGHRQSVRNWRCNCGWRPNHNAGLSPSTQHTDHLGEILEAVVRDEKARLENMLLDIDSMLSEHYVALYATSSRMLEQGALPKAQREDGYDHEATMRYAAYAAQARVCMMLVRDKIAGKK
jgi:hypothetical protein